MKELFSECKNYKKVITIEKKQVCTIKEYQHTYFGQVKYQITKHALMSQIDAC
jgi:hypothetical protein